MAQTPWSRLTSAGKTRLRKSGVQPASYNAYEKRSKKAKATVNRADFIRGKTSQQIKDKERKEKRKSRHGEAVNKFVAIMKRNGRRFNRKTIAKSVGVMTDVELNNLLNGDEEYESIAARARQPPDPDTGWNSGWYG